MKAVTKNKILQQAARVFFAESFAVGIDRVIRECDTAKMTIYSEFKSKDGLIGAILLEARRALARRIAEIIEPDLPATIRLRAVFSLVCYGMHDPAYKLGLGVRALAEFPGPEHPVHQAALELDRAILGHLQPVEGSISPQQARQLLLLAKGCFLMAPLLGINDSRQVAMDQATLLFNQCRDRFRISREASRISRLLQARLSAESGAVNL